MNAFQGVPIGSRIYFKEMLFGKLPYKYVVVMQMDSGRHIECAPTPGLMRQLPPRMVFGLEPVAEQRARSVANRSSCSPDRSMD